MSTSDNQPGAVQALTSNTAPAASDVSLQGAESVGMMVGNKAIKEGLTLAELATNLGVSLGEDESLAMSDPLLAQEQLETVRSIAPKVQETGALLGAQAIRAQRAESRVKQLEDMPRQVFLSQPGVKRILSDFEEEISDPEEGTPLFETRQRQRELRSEIFSTKEKYEEAVNGLGEFKYDPYKAFPTSGSKAAALIGILLGGIGASLRGGENQVFNYFNQVIDREMNRQKLESENLSQRAGGLRNLYTMNLELLGSEEAAEKLTLDQIAKSYDLEIRAYINDIGDINKRNLAMGEYDLATKKLRAEQEKARQLTDTQINRSNEMLTASKVSKSTAGQLGTAIANVDRIAEGLGILGKKPRTLGKLKESINTLAMSVAQSDNDLFKATLNALSDEDSFQPYVELASVLRPIAFGLAREGQSASSISNRDVSMFLSILADPVRNLGSIRDSLTFMKQKAERDAIVDRVAAENPQFSKVQIENDLLARGVIQKSIGLDEFLESKGQTALASKLREDYEKVVKVK